MQWTLHCACVAFSALSVCFVCVPRALRIVLISGIAVTAVQARGPSQPTGVTTLQGLSVPRVKDIPGDLSPSEVPVEDGGVVGEAEVVVGVEASCMIAGEALMWGVGYHFDGVLATLSVNKEGWIGVCQ